jgi:hypothetical protein
MGIFPEVKRLEREVNHSLPCSAEVKNEWSNISASSLCLHSVDRKNFECNYTINITILNWKMFCCIL